MVDILQYAVLSVVTIWMMLGVTWLFYLVNCSLNRQPNVPFLVKPFACMATWLGTGANVVWNVVFGTLVFLEIPKDLYFTSRVSRLKNGEEGWRKELANWFCKELLDPYDSKGYHCG